MAYAMKPCRRCGAALHIGEAAGVFRIICPACVDGPLAADLAAREASVPCTEFKRTGPPARFAVRWRSTPDYPVSSDGWLSRGWVEDSKKRLVRQWFFVECAIWDGESFPTVEAALRGFAESGLGGPQYFEAVTIPPRPVKKMERRAW